MFFKFRFPNRLYVLPFLLVALFYTSFSKAQNAHLPNAEQIQQLLAEHNKYRKEVSVPPLVWSESLSKEAYKWAQSLKKNRCGFYHSKTNYGENLWKGTTGYYSIADVIKSWGSEKKDYNYTNNSCKGVCGHYTQMVWKNTTEVGCAAIECNGMTLWVCNYNPPGNYRGQKPY
jgi:pathogenesis-related protein 1